MAELKASNLAMLLVSKLDLEEEASVEPKAGEGPSALEGEVGFEDEACSQQRLSLKQENASLRGTIDKPMAGRQEITKKYRTLKRKLQVAMIEFQISRHCKLYT